MFVFSAYSLKTASYLVIFCSSIHSLRIYSTLQFTYCASLCSDIRALLIMRTHVGCVQIGYHFQELIKCSLSVVLCNEKCAIVTASDIYFYAFKPENGGSIATGSKNRRSWTLRLCERIAAAKIPTLHFSFNVSISLLCWKQAFLQLSHI